jgi:RNA polymerase sigma-70 factor (ECF subfamily)
MPSAVPDDLMRLLPRLRRYARLLSADDDAADDLVLLAIERALDGTRARTPALHEAMAIVHALHREGTARRGRTMLRRLERTLLHRRPAPGGMVAQLRSLPIDERAVLALVAVEGFAYGDVAAVLGVPVATAMELLVRARGRLRGGDEFVTRSAPSP